jgi:hypothetical protein
MPRSKRKFAQWTYVDEATRREHPIQVYIMTDDNDRVSFEASVTTPEKFTDTDENVNTLKARVFMRCAEREQIVWVPYFLVTVHTEGFKPSLFDGSKRHFSVSLLIEDVDVVTLSNGETIWRGGKLSKFGPMVKPGWPPVGKTKAGGDACTVAATSTNQIALDALYKKFAKVGKGMRAAANPKSVLRNFKLLLTEMEDTHWKDFLREDQTPNPEEDPCQPMNEPSSAQSEPSVDAQPAKPTANVSLAI